MRKQCVPGASPFFFARNDEATYQSTLFPFIMYESLASWDQLAKPDIYVGPHCTSGVVDY